MKKTHIILHHSLTKDSGTVSWNAIRKYHMSKGWKDIGYHFGVEIIDDNYEILVGRMLTETGAHCREENMNKKGIGICFIGNYDSMMLPIKMLSSGVRLIKSLMEIFNIPVDNVQGHREYNSHKSCPGSLFDINTLRYYLKFLN